MVFLSDIEKDEQYVKLDESIEITKEIKCIGFFPYHTKRVRGVKVDAAIYESVLLKLRHTQAYDNKIVLVFDHTHPFGTVRNFAIFYHDGGCVIGALENIDKY